MKELSSEKLKRLEGKIALVTGAARGIGRGIAICMAEEGADVVVSDNAAREERDEVAKIITGMGRRAIAWRADVSDRTQVQGTVACAIEHFGKLDIAVANPAYSVRQAFIDARWEDVERAVSVSQFGVFHVSQLSARQMVAQGAGGKIIIIGSIHAEVPFARSAAYNMAKAAISHLAATMAGELAPYHINVNVISPGWIGTPGESELDSEENMQSAARRIPWGRLGTPRDIGRCAVFLACDDADYITGSCLRVDGGLTLGLQLPRLDVRTGSKDNDQV